MNDDYKTIDGLTRNGCDQESAEKIAMLVQKMDECFEEHNHRCEQKACIKDD